MAGKAIKQLSSGGSGQSLSDRMTSAKHIISGSGLGRAVCKATTEEIIAPKKKHLGYLIECTNQSNVSIPELANALLERLSSSNWVVVFKALVSIHSVMNYGNERFTQYLASNNCNLSLRNFYDKSSVQGADMSRFICRYSAYVQEKAFAYRSLAYDLCKVKRGSDDGALRTQSVEKLLRSLPVLIAQFDALLGFDATPSELSNPIINAAFLMLYKDASRLFVVFNDGVINLLSTFFESMNRKQCREGLELYKKFLVRSERLAEFSRVAESAGVDRADVANLERHPTSFLEAMESHLAQLEGRRISRSNSSNSIGSAASPTPPTAAAVSASAAASAAPVSSASMSEAQRQALLMEEQRQLDLLKAERQRKLASSSSSGSGSQGAAKPPQQPQQQPPQQPQQQPPPQQKSNDEDNLLNLMDSTPAISSTVFSPFPPAQQQQQQQQQQQPAFAPFSTASFSAFPPTTAFPAAAYSTAPAAFSAAPPPASAASVFDPFGGVLEPTRPGQQAQQRSAAGAPAGQAAPVGHSGLTGDLDSSLAALAGRLDMRGPQSGQSMGAGRQGVNWAQAGGANSARTVGGGGPAAPVPIAPGPTVNWGGGAMALTSQPARFAMPQQFGSAYAPAYGPGYGPYGPGQQQWLGHPTGPQYQPGQPTSGQQNGSSDPFGAL
ncbi:hypothetical protein BOX15_Mlig000891g3 [Macrostomum lignano]|uniref:ENTH domain-containing protein n=1 Tax=Macrostomum lignano TaxID=282301 RepID=A0A267H8K0_9PLAT|nr:hypothetical protein BOX15_Mlig000891g3 [Macrostomum lignano]